MFNPLNIEANNVVSFCLYLSRHTEVDIYTNSILKHETITNNIEFLRNQFYPKSSIKQALYYLRRKKVVIYVNQKDKLECLKDVEQINEFIGKFKQKSVIRTHKDCLRMKVEINELEGIFNSKNAIKETIPTINYLDLIDTLTSDYLNNPKYKDKHYNLKHLYIRRDCRGNIYRRYINLKEFHNKSLIEIIDELRKQASELINCDDFTLDEDQEYLTEVILEEIYNFSLDVNNQKTDIIRDKQIPKVVYDCLLLKCRESPEKANRMQYQRLLNFYGLNDIKTTSLRANNNKNYENLINFFGAKFL